MGAVRLSLSTAISDLFLISAIVGIAGLAVVVFLREDPLWRTYELDPESGEELSEAGLDAVEEAARCRSVARGHERGAVPELRPDAEPVA